MNKLPDNPKILVTRNDKLGDFMLALPAFCLLKKSMPDAEITAFVTRYTAEIAEYASFIDKVLIDDGKSAYGLSKQFQNFDVLIVLFSTKTIAQAGFLSRIKYRLAPATKVWQFLYPQRIKQRRSQSIKPEYEYNLDVVRYFLKTHQITEQLIKRPFLNIPNVKKNPNLIIIHPGSGGSANNLSLNQYAQLADLLYQKNHSIKLLLTAGPSEAQTVKQMSKSVNAPHEILISTDGLMAFCKKIKSAKIFIGGSTGPLHIAGALNIKTIGFYPSRQSATKLRWQTLNEHANRLAFSPANASDDMTKISIKKTAEKIYPLL